MTFSRPPRRETESEAQAWRREADRNVVSLLAEVVMLPFTALLYGMELLLKAMHGMQGATQQGVDVMVGAPPRPLSHPQETLPEREGGESGHHDPLATRGTAGNPEPQPAYKEAAAMDTGIGHESRRDRDLHDDMLKLVRYKVLFVRREYEVAFPEQEDLVEDNMDPTSFAAWKVAEFVQRLHRDGADLPARWRDRKYPFDRDENGKYRYVSDDEKRLIGLPEQDKKYLRVYYEVLDRYPREKFKHEEQQIRVLEEIRDELHKKKA